MSEYELREENEKLRNIIVKLELELLKKEKEFKNLVDFSNNLFSKNKKLEDELKEIKEVEP